MLSRFPAQFGSGQESRRSRAQRPLPETSRPGSIDAPASRHKAHQANWQKGPCAGQVRGIDPEEAMRIQIRLGCTW
jgi:hypothetical protein